MFHSEFVKMWRNENRPTPAAGSLSVPAPGNQRKRSRLPLTSNPSESELFYTNNYSESGQWDQSVSFTSQQANMKPFVSPSMAGHGYAPIPYPKKPAYGWSQNWQQRPPMKQDSVPAVGFHVHGGFPSSSSSSLGQPRWSSGFQNQINRPTTSFRMPYTPQQCNPAAINTEDPGAQSQSRRWNFRSTGPSGSGMSTKVKKDTSQDRINPQHQKPQREKSLRVITAVIEGMKHWGQYTNRAPMLFEIFATLDSAVTVADYGAKKFLMRDGKDVVQCLYFENDQTLPKLIRGQAYRCIGNYSKQTDTMTCVSVRAASLSEQRNSQEAVKASDTEMRNVVLVRNEI
ncbi:spermatogenesis-associated protein 22 isoform X1 [Triplophysa rosa]|uniref:spermatogenesis-associated protein 22 isoform X1 n=2 Tax=Triplophysa rosa TaxID=992332 RepID=UPI002545F728|nr:spermatogenesis-associated protein 22 isoform X1 [Triplophysa rosa]